MEIRGEGANMTENNIDTYMLEDARREVAELKAELKLNASMLARQTDLARVAETESMKLRREVEGLKCCGNCADKHCVRLLDPSTEWRAACDEISDRIKHLKERGQALYNLCKTERCKAIYREGK